MDDISHNSGSDPNLLGTNRNDDGRWLNAYYDNLNNRWNRENGFAFAVSQISSFLSLLNDGRVLFCDLSVPSAEHFTDLIYFDRYYNIFFIIRDFVSHKIISNIFRVSVFLIANLTHGCFSSRDRKLAIATASIISTKRLSIF